MKWNRPEDDAHGAKLFDILDMFDNVEDEVEEEHLKLIRRFRSILVTNGFCDENLNRGLRREGEGFSNFCAEWVSRGCVLWARTERRKLCRGAEIEYHITCAQG